MRIEIGLRPLCYLFEVAGWVQAKASVEFLLTTCGDSELISYQRSECCLFTFKNGLIKCMCCERKVFYPPSSFLPPPLCFFDFRKATKTV